MKNGTRYYIYSVADKKFLTTGYEDVKLTDAGLSKFRDVIFHETGNADYPFYFTDKNDNWYNLRSQLLYGVLVINYWKKLDEGNQLAIIEAADFDAEAQSEANAIITAESVIAVDGIEYLINSWVHTAFVTGYTSDLRAEVEIPSAINYDGNDYSVTSVNPSAFSNCSKLRSIIIPESVTSIGANAFSGCSNLANVSLPADVTLIASRTFQGCSSLSSITIPESVTSIEPEAFKGCSSLTSVAIPNGVTYLGVGVFGDCISLSSVTIPEGVTGLEQSTFSGCSGLISVTIPKNVDGLCDYVFSGCTNLSEINLFNSAPPLAHDNTFEGVDKSACVLKVPDGCREVYSAAPYWKEFMDIVDELPATATRFFIGYLQYLTNPEDMTASVIGHTNGLPANVEIPSAINFGSNEYHVTSIGKNAFRNCSNLISVAIPESVTSIKGYAFQDCSNLSSMTIPAGVTSIGNGAFCGCSSLTSVTIPVGVTSIGDCTFENCSGLTSVTIPTGVKYIHRHAFCGCSNLTSITIPENVNEIGDETFAGCSSLTEIKSLMPEPSFAYSTTFNEIDKEACTLFVPEGSLEAYRSHPHWEVFQNIIEMANMSSIDELRTLVNGAIDLYDNSREGTADGQYAPGSREVFVEVINDVNAQISDNMTVPEVTQCMTDLQEALDAFESQKVTLGPDTDVTQYDNAIYINKTESLVGLTTTLSINLKNTLNVAGFQFDLYLPEGLTFVLDENGEVDATLSGERDASKKMDLFSFAFQPDGALRILAASTSLKTLPGNDGEVVLVRVKVAEDMAEGDYPIILREIEIASDDETYARQDRMKSTFTVSACQLGDANADGKVSVVDVIAASRYILGRTPESFVFVAADVNGDARISVVDLVSISKIALNIADVAMAKAPARASADATGRLDVVKFDTEAGSTAMVDVRMSNNVPILGFQFDMELPEGVTLQSVALEGNRSSVNKMDILDFARLDDGRYRVLCASTSCIPFAGNDGTVIRLAIETENGVASDDYNMNVSNIVLADENGGIYPEGFAVPFRIVAATHINELGVDADMTVDVYNNAGILLRSKVKAGRCLEGLPKGIYIVNGQKIEK